MHARPDAPAADTGTRLLRPRSLVLWLVLYLGCHLLARVAASDALELDEGEQVLWSQQLAPGYGPQPPLYTWLQFLVFELFGLSVFSLALLKNLLLAGTYVFTFRAARTLMPLPPAALSAASMLLLPQIGWESQRDLTHSVLATTLAALTLWLVLELVRMPSSGARRHSASGRPGGPVLRRARPALYVALGATAGLGVLAKYSFAGFAFALLVALLLGRETRPLVLDRWIIVAAAIAAALVAPHAAWLLDHGSGAAEHTLGRLHPAAPASWLAGVVQGFGSLALSLVAFVTPLWIVLMLVFRRAGPSGDVPPHAATGRALLARYAVVLLAMFAAMVLFGGATKFKDRWMQPFLFCAPLVYFAFMPQLAGHARLPLYTRLLLVTSVLFVVLLGLRVPVNGWRGKPDELNMPIGALARALRDAGYDGRAIIGTERALAGSLRLRFPEAAVQVVAPAAARSEPGTAALWIGPDDGRAPSPPPAQRIALPYRFARPQAPLMRYWFILEPGTTAR